MATERLRYLIEAVWSGKGATVSASKDIGSVGESGKATKASLQDLATTAAISAGAIGAAALAAKKVFDFSKESAALAQTSESFDRLTGDILGVPDALERLREASRGTIDDMTLMAGVMTLTAGQSQEMATQFVNAAPQLLEIAKAANKLNPALGDTAFLYESISTGIKRSSPLILDNLGIVVKVGEANEKYAESLGKTSAELTAAEKQVALLNAVLETGDTLIQQAGGNVDALGDSFVQAEVKIKNFRTAFMAAFGQGASQAQSSWLDGIEIGFNKLFDTTGLTTEQIAGFLGVIATGRPDLIKFEADLLRLNDAIQEASSADQLLSNYRGFVSTAGDLEEIAAQAEAARAAIAGLTQEDAFEDGAGLIPNLAHVQEFIADLTAGGGSAAETLARIRGEYVALIEAGRTERGESFTSFFDATELGQFEQVMLNVAAAGGTAGEQILGLAGNTEAARKAMTDAAFAQFAKSLGDDMAAGIITWQDALTNLQTFMEGFDLDAYLASQNIAGSGEQSTEHIKDTMLGYVEGIDAVAAKAAGSAATETDKVLEKAAELAGPWPYEIQQESLTNALTGTQELIDKLRELEGIDPVINIQTNTPTGIIGHAAGGGVSGGIPTIVGEQGPEIFVPQTAGMIIPNHKIGSGNGGGGVTFNVQVFAAPGMSEAALINQMRWQVNQMGFDLRGT